MALLCCSVFGGGSLQTILSRVSLSPIVPLSAAYLSGWSEGEIRVTVRVVMWNAAVAADGDSLVFIAEADTSKYDFGPWVEGRVKNVGEHAASHIVDPGSGGGGCFEF
jgi:hypothetical protein